LKKRLQTDAKSKPIMVAADALGTRMDAIEEKIIQPKSTSNEDPLNYPIQVADQLMALQSSVESADAAPTAQAYVVFEELNGRLEKQLAAWGDVQSKELRELNELILKSNVPVIGLAAKSEQPPM
jgi:hypothetical protein